MIITGLNKAEVLAALYNNSRPFGLGALHFDPAPMTTQEAQRILDVAGDDKYFDYLKGRVMKIDMSSDDELNTRLYNRDLGEGAAERVIEALKVKVA